MGCSALIAGLRLIQVRLQNRKEPNEEELISGRDMTSILGAETSRFGPNKATLIVVGVIGLSLFFLFEKSEMNAPAYTMLSIFGLLFAWVSSVRVSLHEDGIFYRSFLGLKEMRWDEVERFYYSATKRSINFIPVGTYYWFKLIDAKGQKLTFDYVERLKDMGAQLVEYTYEPLLQK